MHYEKGCKFANVKHKLDSDCNRGRLSLLLFKILIFRSFVYNIFIYAIKYDENGVDKSDGQVSNQAVKSNLLEVLKIIYSHRVSIVRNVASNKKEACSTYESSYLINDYLPRLPLFL